jgi:RNA polymerase sigma-70 factor (family 1)
VENPDLEILAGIKKGDEKAFDYLFNIYYDDLCNYAVTIIKDGDLSEDIVQNIMADLWINRQKVSIHSSLRSYLFRSVYNASIDHLRHIRSREKFLSDSVFEDSSSFESTVEYQELTKRINDVIETLPEQCKVIFRLSRFENLKYREIAQKLNISENTVDTQIRRALKKLRESLNDFFEVIILMAVYFFTRF